MLRVAVSSGVTARVSVLTVSHPPATPGTVSVIVLAPLNTCPSQVYGSWLAHTVMLRVAVSSGVTARVSVLTVSHPPATPGTVSVIVLAPLNTCPSQVYGSWLAHTVMLRV